jgi:indole-3-glycerol phosphate synthase
MSGRLAGILAAARTRAETLRPQRAVLRRRAEQAPLPPRWETVFVGEHVAVIGEVKRRSPSSGPIAEHLSPAAHARAYVSGGAAGVSVLTDPVHFGGSLDDLTEVAGAVSVPVLRKDFILDEAQLYEARLHGASAVLLIVRALDRAALGDLAAGARDLGLGRLVEVHDLTELDRALEVAPETIGVNARDLDTFAVDVERVEPVLRAVPSGHRAIAESGLATRADVERVASWGADAVLVGTAIASAGDPAAAVRRLVGVARVGRRASGLSAERAG